MRSPQPGLRGSLALAAVGLLAASACAAPTPTSLPSTLSTALPATPGASATPSETAGPTAVPSSAPTASASAAPSRAPSATKVALVQVVKGLTAPLLVTNAGDGSGRLFIVEQAGRVRVVRDGRLTATPYLDLGARISSGGERGLLGLAFSPAFARDGRLYVDYTDRDGNTVVSELTARDPTADRVDPSTERVLLRIRQPYPNHNGGDLAVQPDGLLWIATGDGGSAGDPHGNGQRLDTLLGKLLRIDPRPTAGAPYRIPPGNPFVGRAGARPEIWAYGLRNPWRFSFDRSTGDLWIGDVGQNTVEEVDRWRASAPAGPNFGWNRMEGSRCYSPAAGCSRKGLVLPVAEYGHGPACAVTGGYVYRGAADPDLVGMYLFGDFCSGTIWGLDAGAAAPKARVLLESRLAISSFGEDEAGEVYVVDLAGGRVYRVVAPS